MLGVTSGVEGGRKREEWSGNEAMDRVSGGEVSRGRLVEDLGAAPPTALRRPAPAEPNPRTGACRRRPRRRRPQEYRDSGFRDRRRPVPQPTTRSRAGNPRTLDPRRRGLGAQRAAPSSCHRPRAATPQPRWSTRTALRSSAGTRSGPKNQNDYGSILSLNLRQTASLVNRRGSVRIVHLRMPARDATRRRTSA